MAKIHRSNQNLVDDKTDHLWVVQSTRLGEHLQYRCDVRCLLLLVVRTVASCELQKLTQFRQVFIIKLLHMTHNNRNRFDAVQAHVAVSAPWQSQAVECYLVHLGR